MRLRSILAGVFTALSLSGCFSVFPGLYSPLKLTVVTDVPGAMLSQGGQFMGYTPAIVTYRWSGEPCMTLQPLHVQWASGAEGYVEGMRACATDGHLQQRTFFRPKEYPGRDLDVQFAIQLQRTAALEAAAAAQERAAIFGAIAQQNAAATAARKPLRCTSTESNGSVHTTCY